MFFRPDHRLSQQIAAELGNLHNEQIKKPEQNFFPPLVLQVLGWFIHACEFILCLHVFRQTGPPRRVDCLAPPSVGQIKMEASR